MRILHTADWHIGKRLGRYDRMDDHAAVLDEIVGIAVDEAVDLVIVAGDLFDRPSPPIDALGLVLDTLERLAGPERPVVAIAGNHDSPELFELLAPLVEEQNIHLVGALKPPAEGGVLTLTAGGQDALVACLPFLRRGRAVDFLKEIDAWHGDYATKVEQLMRAHDRHLEAHGAGKIRILTAHLMVQGAQVGGLGGPRGERLLHLGDAYATDPEQLPTGAQYVALGHVHTPQDLDGAPVPTLYSGSALELDFGEAGEDKRVVIVELEADRPPSVTSRPLVGGRRLRRASGPWEELRERQDLHDAFLDLTVTTQGPDPGLADRVRHELPLAVKVRSRYELPAASVAVRRDQPWDVLYSDYFRKLHDTEPSAELLEAFREIYELTLHATD